MNAVNVNDLGEFDAVLQSTGVLGALAYLNSRTPHRFTGIFRYDGEQLVNLFIYDRENSKAELWAPFPKDNSYCGVVHDTEASFVVANSKTDARVNNHPASARIASYCGVPLQNSDGSLFGSLCHFDFKPQAFADLDLPFLIAVGERLTLKMQAGPST